MKTNIVIDLSPPILYLAKFWFLSYGPKCCWPIKLQDSLKCYISRNKQTMKYIFGMQVDGITLGLGSQVCSKYPKKQVSYYLCNISKKALRMRLIFCLHINLKGFFKLILSFQVCVASHGQITQSNNFAISLKYLKKEVSDEVDFLHAVSYKLIQ